MVWVFITTWCSDIRNTRHMFPAIHSTISYTASVWAYIQYELYAIPHILRHSWVHICFMLEVNPIFECTCATVWSKTTTFSRWDCVRARWKQQEAASGARVKPFSSQMQIFLESFCLLDLRQACPSLIITQVLFSARCVLYFQREGLVNRSGGVRGDR